MCMFTTTAKTSLQAQVRIATSGVLYSVLCQAWQAYGGCCGIFIITSRVTREIHCPAQQPETVLALNQEFE